MIEGTIVLITGGIAVIAAILTVICIAVDAYNYYKYRVSIKKSARIKGLKKNLLQHLRD